MLILMVWNVKVHYVTTSFERNKDFFFQVGFVLSRNRIVCMSCLELSSDFFRCSLDYASFTVFMLKSPTFW